MPTIEYFYSAHSAFAYLGSARLGQIAREAGADVEHRPFDLRLSMEAIGATPFQARSEAHRAYFFRREIDRWAEHRNAPVMSGTPTHHRKDMTLPNCVLIAGLALGLDIDDLAHALLEAHWRDDADLADETTLARLCRATGHDPSRLLETSASPEVRERYRINTEEAIARSVFGSPTYFVGGDMFYGQDHLEMVERALRRPYAGAPAAAADG